MGAAAASVRLLGDAVSTAQRFVDVFVGVYILIIFAYIVTTWIRLPYSFNRVQQFLYDVCNPYLGLFRRFLPQLGPFDLSPLAGVAVLVAIDVIVTRVLGALR